VVPSVRRPCTDENCLPCREDLQDFCSTGAYIERGIKECHGFMTESFVERERYLTYVPPELRDLAYFRKHWPEAIEAVITRRYPIDSCRELLLDQATGIKNVISFD